MKFGLEQNTIDKLIAAFEQFTAVDKAIIFGSRAKGNYRPDSDIDIAIKGQDITTDVIIAMSIAFEEKGITHKIDLLNYDTIVEPALKEHIDRVGVEFYSRWKEYKLGDIANITSSKRIFFSDYVTSGIPFYRSKEIIEKAQGDDISIDLFITKEKFYEIKDKYGAPQNGDILISAVGERAGIPYCVNNDGDFYFKDGNLIWFRNFNSEISSNFLVYYFNSSIGQQRLESTMIGSAQKALTIIGLKNLEVAFPPIEEQTAIASILSSLDDKIDLLQRQNKTLEQLAETLFRSYFPMTNEENNYIELGNYVECINGVSYKSSELNPSKVGMVSLKSFDRNGGFSIDGFKEFTGKFKEKQIVVEGDLIIAHTDITQDAEVIGNPALVLDNPNFETMTISMDIVKVISKVDWISIEFLYFLMKTREFKSHCEGCANGSTVLHLNKQAIPTFEFPEPEKNKIADFTNQAKEIVNKIFLNHRQLRILVKTRDTLLPKLMSGEVRVNF